MYTLKIHWVRYERDDESGIVGAADETTLFIPAEQVRVHGRIDAGQRETTMRHWHAQPDGPGYFNYLSQGVNGEDGGRLICVVKDEIETWYAATAAWVMGPDGKTIERVAP